jgi:hypothetical protein
VGGGFYRQGRSVECRGHITGVVGPVMCHLSSWTPLITAPEAVVGRLLGLVSPGTQGIGAAGPLGAASPPPWRVMHQP